MSLLAFNFYSSWHSNLKYRFSFSQKLSLASLAQRLERGAFNAFDDKKLEDEKELELWKQRSELRSHNVVNKHKLWMQSWVTFYANKLFARIALIAKLGIHSESTDRGSLIAIIWNVTRIRCLYVLKGAQFVLTSQRVQLRCSFGTFYRRGVWQRVIWQMDLCPGDDLKQFSSKDFRFLFNEVIQSPEIRGWQS